MPIHREHLVQRKQKCRRARAGVPEQACQSRCVLPAAVHHVTGLLDIERLSGSIEWQICQHRQLSSHLTKLILSAGCKLLTNVAPRLSTLSSTSRVMEIYMQQTLIKPGSIYTYMHSSPIHFLLSHIPSVLPLLTLFPPTSPPSILTAPPPSPI